MMGNEEMPLWCSYLFGDCVIRPVKSALIGTVICVVVVVLQLSIILSSFSSFSSFNYT
jgi:hypothetical protein